MLPVKDKTFARTLLTTAITLALSGCLFQQARPGSSSEEDALTGTQKKAQQAQLMPVERIEKVHPAPPDNMWDRIRLGMKLDHDHAGIKNDLEWYARHQAYLDRVAERARPYLYLIVKQVQERGMPTEIALLPIVESAFQPFAYSHGRAAGLWQFVPGTGRRFHLKQTWWYDGRRDVAESTRAALDYLEYLHQHFDNDWLLALAAYNSGEGTVQHAIRKNRRRHQPTDFWHLDLPKETRGYVPRLLAISELVANPDQWGVTLEPIPNQPFLTAVDAGSQIDLDLAAELAGVSLEEMYRYNPAFNRWATDPKGPHKLLLPVDKADQFKTALADLPKRQRVKWVRHRIRSGDSLGTIAANYRTTVKLLRSVNGLHGNTIRAGHSLVVPVARKQLSHYRLSAEQRRKATQRRHRSGHKIQYIVQDGDTLWDIAREYDVGVYQLAKWNGMAPRDVLRPGKRLVIWGQQAQSDQVSGNLLPAAFTHPQRSLVRRRIGYVVRSGDSLARISQRFRVSVSDLQRWNGIDPDEYLQPGQHLVLYVDVTRQSGNI